MHHSRPMNMGFPDAPLGGHPMSGGLPGTEMLQGLFSKLGVDPTYFGTIIMCLTMLSSLGAFLRYILSSIHGLWSVIACNMTSSAEIHSSDQAFLFVMRWLAVHGVSTDCREFRVSSRKNVASSRFKRFSMFDHSSRGGQNDDDDDEDTLGPKMRYNPSAAMYYFFYRRHLVIMQRKDDKFYLHGDTPDETITLRTIGRSPRILRLLLAEARSEYLEHRAQSRKTMVFSPSTNSEQNPHHHHNLGKCWDMGQARTARDIQTVIMEDKDKELILRDTKEYLNPVTARWYAARGLPYRRGYLFYGPPGTGKTSLSLALAGELKLDLYIFNLASGSDVTDESLIRLFQALPKKCIVLLEDIDCAGIGRRRTTQNASVMGGGGGGAQQSPEDMGDAMSSSMRRPGVMGKPKSEGVSLSGLLNAIDGVASQEGRILIMTTNYRDQLDSALIRPGRVDVEIELGHADQEATKRVFSEIYSCVGDREANPSDIAGDPEEKSNTNSANGTNLTPAEINALAIEFSQKVPPKVFSPAELQGFLIQRKHEPEKAILEISEWVQHTLKQKVQHSGLRTDVANDIAGPDHANLNIGHAAALDFNSGASTACESESDLDPTISPTDKSILTVHAELEKFEMNGIAHANTTPLGNPRSGSISSIDQKSSTKNRKKGRARVNKQQQAIMIGGKNAQAQLSR